jgi:aminoglycoside phosphotransferase (APT) family kinase protein
MTLATQRDLAAVAAAMEKWLAARRGVDSLRVTRCERPDEGLSSETLMVDAAGSIDGRDHAESLVVRMAPPASGAFPEYDLAAQAVVQEAVAANGVPAAAPVEYEADPQWLGASFMVMPAIAGYIPGQMPLTDTWINQSEESAATVSRTLYDVLASIHRVDWRAAGLADALPARDIDAELAYWARYLRWYGDGEDIVPALSAALTWCAARRPENDPPPVLLWGDVRLGNIIWDDDRRPVAVLDWEMTTIGAAEHDLAWYLTLEAIQNELLGRTMPGFLGHDEACSYYEAQAGRPLQHLDWFEIFAMVRSSAIMSRLNYLQEREGQKPMLPLADNPLLDILNRRITEASAR